MADTATVELEDDGVVTIDVDDATVTETEPVQKVADVAKPTTAPRTRQAQPALVVPSAADEASAALTQAVKTAEDARKAAEATALAERRRADDAARLASQREEEAKGYRERAETGEMAIIDSGIENTTREIATHKADMQRAWEAGEFAAAAEAQAKLSEASAVLVQHKSAKANFEAGSRKTTTTEGRVEAPQAQQSAFEQYVGQFEPRSQAWLRTHPECVPPQHGGDSSGRKNAEMMTGHYAALAKGLQPNTEAYFQTIEEHTGHRVPVTPAAPISVAAQVTPAGEDEPSPAPKPRQTRQAQPSAPVSRDAPGPNGVPMSKSVTLTRDQQEIALLATSPREVLMADGRVVKESDADFRKRAFGQYARELMAATAEGKIGRLTH